MLSLDSSRWQTLNHAYGPASDIPALLRKLDPKADEDAPRHEPWFSLWSALAHQGDVYSATFATVPHIIQTFSLAPAKASYQYLQFSAWVEVCRVKNAVAIPEDLESDYVRSLARIPSLIALAAKRTWTPDLLRCALSALAASKGFPRYAEVIQEIEPDNLDAALEWLKFG